VQRVRHCLSHPATIFAVALLVRLGLLAAGIAARPQTAVGHIPFLNETGCIARAIAEGRGFSSPLIINSGPTAWTTPLYPYLLAGIFKILGIETLRSEIAIKVCNDLFSALVCFPLYSVGKKLFGTTVGALSAWLWAFLSSAIYFANVWVWDTSLSALALTTVLWATYEIEERPNNRLWVAYGALCAFAVLVNAALLVVLPGLFCYVAYRIHRHSVDWVKFPAMATLAFAIGVSPWIIRNQIVFHGQVLFKSTFGVALWLGNNPQVPDTWSWWLHPTENAEEAAEYRRMGEVAYMQEKEKLAFAFIKTHPLDSLRFDFRRFMYTWTESWEPIADVWHLSALPVLLVVCWNYLFALLALLGLLLARRAVPIRYLPLLIVCVFFPLVFYISVSTPRYRHPIDPMLTLLAVYSATQIVMALSRKLQPKPDLPATVEIPS
jgi:4-amino-4-deoxy-L-arabinose transferase-like glycosyltransferase